MADDGYLIGFEDSSGNFVEVGRFNNLSGNTSDPVFIEHTGSGTRMELDGSGFDMNGGDITNAGSVSTGSATINGATIKSESEILSDDEAADFGEIDGSSRFVWVYEDSGKEQYGYFQVTFDDTRTLNQEQMSNQNSGSLTGTTGPDGTINISMDGAVLNLENRTGGQIDIRVVFLGD